MLPNAATMEDNLQRFNLETMSGVFPGTRTKIFERVRLIPPPGSASSPRWARISWYEEPPACLVELEAARPSSGTSSPAEHAPDQESLPARFEVPRRADASAQLSGALRARGWQLQTCGTCQLWQPLVSRTRDGLSSGRCTWSGANKDGLTVPAELATQSSLALSCIHWNKSDDADTAVDLGPEAATELAPIRKRAEQESDERWSLWGRIRRTLSERGRSTAASRWSGSRLAATIVERSGVGAGTEPCLVCQGRIANLGALTVATPEGDRQTYSVWRCRACYTCYLNDWIDRWERSDSLETEESYYRVAPQEALELLKLIDSVVDAEHPARRQERTAERMRMLEFISDRRPLSHEIKQGR